MRIILIILGIAALVAGVAHPIFCLHSETETVLHFCAGAALVAASVCYFIAAAKRYRGHWAFVTGVALIAFGFFGLGAEIDDALTGRSEDTGFRVGLLLFFVVSGALSLWSGHKLHRCSLELERVKNELEAHAADQSQPSDNG